MSNRMDELKKAMDKALGQIGTIEGLDGLIGGLDGFLKKMQDRADEEEIHAGRISPAIVKAFAKLDQEAEDVRILLQRESEDWHRAFDRKQDEYNEAFSQRRKAIWELVYDENGIEKTEDDERHFRVDLSKGTVSQVIKKPKEEEENVIDFRPKS